MENKKMLDLTYNVITLTVLVLLVVSALIFFAPASLFVDAASAV